MRMNEEREVSSQKINKSKMLSLRTIPTIAPWKSNRYVKNSPIWSELLRYWRAYAMIKRPIPRIKSAKKKPRLSNISVKFRPKVGIQSIRAVTTSPAITDGKLVSRPTNAARVTVNVTPAVADLPAAVF